MAGAAGHLSLGLLASTWSYAPSRRVTAPENSLTAIVMYRTPSWRLRFAAPYFPSASGGTQATGNSSGGFGRLNFGADYYVRPGRDTVIKPYLRLLVDTGTVPAGLVSGNAAELGLAVTQVFAHGSWSVTGQLGLRRQAVSGGGQQSNSAAWLIGTGFRLTRRDVLELAVVNRQSYVSGFADMRSLVLLWSHDWQRKWSLQISGAAGLTSTSPQYGASIGGAYRF